MVDAKLEEIRKLCALAIGGSTYHEHVSYLLSLLDKKEQE